MWADALGYVRVLPHCEASIGITAISIMLGPRQAFQAKPATSNNPQPSALAVFSAVNFPIAAKRTAAPRTIDPAFYRDLAAGRIANGKSGFGLIGSRGMLRDQVPT